MPTPTYVPLANITLGSSAATVTFSSISGAYRDLVLVATHRNTTTATSVRLRYNGDSGSNYTTVWMGGTGSGTFSGTFSGDATIITDSNTGNDSISITHILDYSATDKHKTQLSRGSGAGINAIAFAGRWANTAAITSIVASYPGGGSFTSGSTFALYGIVA